jgi:hypothetical protein
MVGNQPWLLTEFCRDNVNKVLFAMFWKNRHITDPFEQVGLKTAPKQVED